MNKVTRWQYNGIAPMDDIAAWCNIHFKKDEWMLNCETIYFFNPKIYILFVLRWQ